MMTLQETIRRFEDSTKGRTYGGTKYAHGQAAAKDHLAKRTALLVLKLWKEQHPGQRPCPDCEGRMEVENPDKDDLDLSKEEDVERIWLPCETCGETGLIPDEA